MGRVRTGYHREVYDLDIGEEITVLPETAEPPDRAIARLKRWASKITDRSYRMRLEAGKVRIQRTPLGMNGRLADWQMMPAETRLLLKANASPTDLRKAKRTADYLSWEKKVRQMDGGKVRYTHQVGSWYAYIDFDCTLYAVCGFDVEGNCMTDAKFRTWPVRHLWAGEWA